MAECSEQLVGTVEHIVFCNEDNGWTVLELDTGTTLETVVGADYWPFPTYSEMLFMI